MARFLLELPIVSDILQKCLLFQSVVEAGLFPPYARLKSFLEARSSVSILPNLSPQKSSNESELLPVIVIGSERFNRRSSF